jgi:hypothetical protein
MVQYKLKIIRLAIRELQHTKCNRIIYYSPPVEFFLYTTVQQYNPPAHMN